MKAALPNGTVITGNGSKLLTPPTTAKPTANNTTGHKPPAVVQTPTAAVPVQRQPTDQKSHRPNNASSPAVGQGKSGHAAPATPITRSPTPNKPTAQAKPTAGSGSGAAAGRNTGTGTAISFSERKMLPPSNPDLAALPKGASWTENGFRTARGAEYERIHARDSLHQDVYTRNGRYYALDNGKLNPIPAKEVQTVPRLTPSTNANGAITAADLANAARNSGKIELPLYNVGEANHLPGSKNGLIAVLEPTGTGNPAAAAYQAGTAGAVSDIATGKQIAPALRYNNPNPRGMDFVKFDGYEVLPNGQTMLLIDAKMRLPVWSESTRSKSLETLRRVKTALDQNPGFRVMYEFPSETSRQEALQFIRDNGFSEVIKTRVRGQ